MPEKWTLSKELDSFYRRLNELLEELGFGPDFFAREKAPHGEPTRPINDILEMHSLVGLFRPWGTMKGSPPIDTVVEDGKYTARVDLPGIDPNKTAIEVTGDRLTIKGYRNDHSKGKDGDRFRHEIRYGAFERSIRLPEGIRADDLRAIYQDGVLEISAPRASKTRILTIQTEGREAEAEN